MRPQSRTLRLGILILAASAAAQTPGFRAVRECAQCHPAQAKPQPATSMAHALELPSECTILASHPVLTFRKENYSWRIERKGGQSIYSVTDGVDTLSVPIKYALGQGFAGQTYVFEKDGVLYESYISFYREINGLDITIGDYKLRPTNLIQAAGRVLGDREVVLCFGCHSTNSIADDRFVPASLIPGVQCEHCHGDSSRHLDGLRTGDPKLFAMKDLRGMTGEDAAHFCGQCHRTWEQIASNGPHGQNNVRFQPYRLTNSKCFDADDKRISCLACHDPHREIDRISAHYDSKCQACHGGGKPGAVACKVGTKDCAGCHMPKIELMGGHHKFSDHEIRIVKPGETYPD